MIMRLTDDHKAIEYYCWLTTPNNLTLGNISIPKAGTRLIIR